MTNEQILNRLNLSYPKNKFKILKSGLVYSTELKTGIIYSNKNRPHKSSLPKKCEKVILYNQFDEVKNY